MGEPQPIARLGPNLIASLERFTLNLSCDGVLREVGTGANVLGSPLLAIAHLISVLAKQPQYMPLQTDELVTTGTITTAKPAHAGQTWRTEVNGIALPGTATGFTQ